MTSTRSSAWRRTISSVMRIFSGADEASRYRSSGSAIAYVMRSESGRVTRTSMQSAGAM